MSSIDLAKHSSHLSNCPAHQQRPVLNQQGRRRLPLDGGMWSSHALLLPLPPRLPLLILKAKRRAQIVVKRSFNEPHDFNALLSFQPGQNILAMLLTWPARGPLRPLATRCKSCDHIKWKMRLDCFHCCCPSSIAETETEAVAVFGPDSLDESVIYFMPRLACLLKFRFTIFVIKFN